MSLYAAAFDAGKAEQTNFNVDYIIVYRFATTDKSKAEARFAKLIESLASVGLSTEVRTGENCSLLIFIRIASEAHLNAEVYRSRVQDWLYGVRTSAPDKEVQKSIQDEPVTEAERLRLIYLLITKPKSEGGAGITAKSGAWENVESIFAPHDPLFNKAWIKTWGAKYFLDIRDLTVIRDRFGEKIAFYFAFLQSYFMFLIFPAVFGFSCWILLDLYSPVYAIVSCLWCATFVEYWKKQEVDLATEWGVRGISRIQHKRPEFRHETEVTDPITGEKIKSYSPFKRLARQALQIPFAIIATLLLGGLIVMCFSIEIFISEVYDGPFKTYLVFLPTIILTAVMPTFSAFLTGIARRLTDLENYETKDAHESAMVQKIFVLNFITFYLPIFLTAFIYVPFATVLVPYLDVLQLTVQPFGENEKQTTAPTAGFQINPDRLKKQVIYFTVTAQIVNFALEVLVPYVKRKAFRKVKEVQAKSAAKKNGDADISANDNPEERSFLTRVRNEAELEVYDVTGDLREMVIQFGYLSLFSVIWPMTAVSFLINNWVELRSDALKITLECQRPVPWRADSIGPWLDSLGFLTWLGSITSSALVFLFYGSGFGPDGDPWNIRAWALLLTIFFSEHIFIAAQLAIRQALSKIDSPGQQKLRAERYSIRKQYLEEALGQEEAGRATSGGIAAGEKIDRESIEEAARQSTLKGNGTPADRFWQRQQNASESIAIGKRLIEKCTPSESKKKQ